MRCSRCGSEMKIKNIKTGTDKNGNPVYHKYAICYTCKIKRDLEKQNAASAQRKRRKKKKRQKKIVLSILLLVLVIATVTAGVIFYRKSLAEKAKKQQAVVTDNRKNLITSGAYMQIKIGMSLDEVKELIGSDGNLLTRSATDTDTSERYQWITKEGDGTVLLTFSNEKLTSISQTGLDESDADALPKDIDSSLHPEMTLQEVSDVMGISGVRISETIIEGITTSVYGWGSQGNGYLYSIVFVDGKAQHIHTPENAEETPVTQEDSSASSKSTK